MEGTAVIPNLSDENSADEVDLNVTVTGTGAEAEALKELMRTTGTDVIRKQLATYIKSLKEG